MSWHAYIQVPRLNPLFKYPPDRVCAWKRPCLWIQQGLGCPPLGHQFSLQTHSFCAREGSKIAAAAALSVTQQVQQRPERSPLPGEVALTWFHVDVMSGVKLNCGASEPSITLLPFRKRSCFKFIKMKKKVQLPFPPHSSGWTASSRQCVLRDTSECIEVRKFRYYPLQRQQKKVSYIICINLL